VTRLPLRWKVTLAFSGALLVVLVAVGAFVYLRFEVELGQSLDRGLRARAAEISALVARSPNGVARTDATGLESDESVAQILRDDGTVVASTSHAVVPLLEASQLRRARTGELFADRPGDEHVDEALRLLAMPVRAGGERFVAVAGASLDEKDEALSSLLVLELVGLAVALVVASAAGYVVAGVALRPVDAMRRRAAEITDQPDRRLPVPPVDDELGRLATTLNAMLDRLERARMTERGAIAKERRFVADASHELRTPLTILKSEIEVALLRTRNVGELEAALASAGEETNRLCRLAEDLLVLAQADDGRLPIRPAPLDVGEMLRAIAARETRRAEAAGRRITVQVPPGLSATADRLHLQRALDNLVDNAFRHGAGDIELIADRDEEGVRIAVRDHGAGFPEDFRPRAFERFSRADAGRTEGGSGLGLAIAQAVALSHGGSVDAENADPGARVRMTLPEA
jgi:two-component system, OmpR family, sensor kinase